VPDLEAAAGPELHPPAMAKGICLPTIAHRAGKEQGREATTSPARHHRRLTEKKAVEC
jgi:hypothetical protein